MNNNEIIKNKSLGEELRKTRKNKGFTQIEIAKKLRVALNRETFTSRQYQNYEAGRFPQFKTEVIKEIDKILDTNFYEKIYETYVPHETKGVKHPPPEENESMRSILLVMELMKEKLDQLSNEVKNVKTELFNLKKGNPHHSSHSKAG